MAIFLALLTMVGWAGSDVFGTITARRMDAYKTTFWAFIITIPALTLLIPLHIHDLIGASSGIIMLTAGLGVLIVISYVAFAEATRISNPSVVGGIAGSFVGLVVILSIIFLGDTLNRWQALAIVIILASLILTSLNFHNLRRRVFKPDRGIALAFLTMIGWGIFFTFIKIPVEHIGWFWPEYISTLAGALVLLTLGFQRVKLSRLQIRGGLPPAAAAAMLGGGGSFTYNLAVQHGHTAVIAPISGCYPVLFVLLSSVIFKEPVTRSQRAGMASTLTGIVALSIVSS